MSGLAYEQMLTDDSDLFCGNSAMYAPHERLSVKAIRPVRTHQERRGLSRPNRANRASFVTES